MTLNKLSQRKQKKTQTRPLPLEQEYEQEDSNEDNKSVILMPSIEEQGTRIVGLYGVIEEEKCAGIISMLYHMRETGKHPVPLEPENPESEVKIEIDPIEFLISTEGGLVSDMFSVYDVMRDVSKDCEISTFGVGKVMSAGVLLLAAGAKGKRRIGKHCRLMLHPISSGNYGQLHDLQNSYKEANILQEAYITELSELSCGKLSKKKIKSLFRKKVDTYFDAQQALEWGIVDEIV